MTRPTVVLGAAPNKVDAILERSGEQIRDCIQCAKCSASCPAGSGMDILPHQVIRLLQLGQLDKVLQSQTIWNCASCFTCAARCPRNIDMANVMEAVRLEEVRRSGGSRFHADDVPKLDETMPQQAVVSGFRKYSK